MEITKSLLWDITSYCNLNCMHCYNADSNNSKELILNIQKDYKEIIDRIENIGVNHIHLLGGEPLMTKGLFDLIDYAVVKGIQVTINTNGTLLTDVIINKLIISKVSQLTISLDGAVEKDNDLIRGPGNFKLVTSNIKKFLCLIEQTKSDMIIQISTVITKQNYKYIHKLPNVLMHLGVKHLDVLKLYECGGASKNNKILYIAPDEYVGVISKLLIESLRNGIFIQIDCKPKVLELIGNKYGIPVSIETDFNGCCAAKKILYMDCSGNIYPCGPFAHIAKASGSKGICTNINDENYLCKITLFNDLIKNKLNANTVPDICVNCSYVGSCSGCAICYNEYDKLCETAYSLNYDSLKQSLY